MAFAAWAEEIPSKMYQIPPGALAGRPQISPELAGRSTITHRSSSVRGLPCGAIFELKPWGFQLKFMILANFLRNP